MWSNDDIEKVAERSTGGVPLRYDGTPYLWLSGNPSSYLTITQDPPKNRAVTWRANPLDGSEPATGYVNDDGRIIFDLPGDWGSFETLDVLGNVVWQIEFTRIGMPLSHVTKNGAIFNPPGGTVTIETNRGYKPVLVDRPTVVFGGDDFLNLPENETE